MGSLSSWKNFYPRSPCGERPLRDLCDDMYLVISIHALLAESDEERVASRSAKVDFYPRSPCGERRYNIIVKRNTYYIFLSTLSLRRATTQKKKNQPGKIFLSTLSLRRATVVHTLILADAMHFYPRSPCGERQLIACQNGQLLDFYPRSPCGERPSKIRILDHILRFLSTLSLRRATIVFAGILPHDSHFYPRSPCGERQRIAKPFREQFKFLSTLSLRRATSVWVFSAGCVF